MCTSKRVTLCTFALVALVSLAASQGGSGARAATKAGGREELLYLGSSYSVTAVSPATGAVRFQQLGAVPARDWSRLYTADFYGGTETKLNTLDARTGKVRSTRDIEGNLVVRAVSDDGASIALMPPGSATDPYHPRSRAQTSLVIARRGQAKPTRLTVQGNIEPEAFSRSQRSLFVIEFTPPEAPDRYRVARLDLASGTLHAVASDEDELQEPMQGTARAQAMAPDGKRLYTLYTRDATESEPAEAFVHVLDLERERATCVDLPPEFATSDLGAVAVSPSGLQLYVVAPTVPLIAEIDTVGLALTRTAALPADIAANGAARATVATAATLYLATDNQMATIDLGTMDVVARWRLPGVVTGVQPAADHASLYVSFVDRVLVLNPQTGSTSREFTVPATGPIDHVAPALPPIVQEKTVRCAC